MPSVSSNLSALNAELTAGPFQGGDVAVQLLGTWVATVQIQLSFDGGTTYAPASTDGTGTPSAINANCGVYVPIAVAGAQVRAEITAYTSGTVEAQMSWAPPATYPAAS